MTSTIRPGTRGPAAVDCASSSTVSGIVAAPTSSTVGIIVGFEVSSMIAKVAT